MSSRYAKMRLERIEKMGEEMMEILPQVTKQKSATNSVSRLTWTVMNCAWCRRRKRLPRSLHEGDLPRHFICDHHFLQRFRGSKVTTWKQLVVVQNQSIIQLPENIHMLSLPTSLKTSLKMLSDLRMEMSDWTARTQHSRFFLLFRSRLMAISSLVGMCCRWCTRNSIS